MKKPNIKYLVITIALVFILLLGSGCEYLSDLGIDIPTLPPTTTTTANTTTPPPSPINPTYTQTPADNQTTSLLSTPDVVALVKPFVVAINTEAPSYDFFGRPAGTLQGAGSGWIIDGSGLIVTNNHVVENTTSVVVILADGRTFPAETIRTDPLTDLAIVQIDATNLPQAVIGDSDALRLGEDVVAIGNQLGQGISVTKGVVSQMGVSLTVDQYQVLYDLIKTDTAINPGNSGGPLVNMAGEVIGITSAKLASIEVEGVGYAISMNSARPIIEELIQRGYVIRPWFGVIVSTVNQFAVMQYELSVDHGAFINQLVAGGPAEEAGLQAGDVIITFNGKDITTAQDLIEAICSAPIGEEVEVGFWRGDTQDTTHAILIERQS